MYRLSKSFGTEAEGNRVLIARHQISDFGSQISDFPISDADI